MEILGIDPGLKGGWARLSDGVLIDWGRMPVKTYGNRKSRAVDASSLWAHLKEVPSPVGVLESVHSMPAQGVSSSFTFGSAWGGALAVLALVCFDDPVLVTPQAWKKYFALGADKRAALQRAHDLWPAEHARAMGRPRAPNWGVLANDGVAEAALIAQWYLDTQIKSE